MEPPRTTAAGPPSFRPCSGISPSTPWIGAGGLTYFSEKIAQIPPRAPAGMGALRDGEKQVGAVHPVLRELEAMARSELRPERSRPWSVPTLLLLGGESPPVYRAGIERMQ